MNTVLGPNSMRLYWAGVNLVYAINFGMNHSPGAGSIARPVDLQSSTPLLYHGCHGLENTNYPTFTLIPYGLGSTMADPVVYIQK